MYLGRGTLCATAECARELLLVVLNSAGLTTEESARKTLLESWGYMVTVIDDSDSQANYDAAVAESDVAYVPEEMDPGQLKIKLRDAPVGVVIENQDIQIDFGFSADEDDLAGTTVEIVDGTHYITQPLGTGVLTILTASHQLNHLHGENAAGVETLGIKPGDASKEYLAVIETGGALYGGGTAPARRVKVPWGDSGFQLASLNFDGQTMLKRSIEWAAGRDTPPAICGDANCDGGEDPCICPADCGAPTTFEEPGATCADGLDNDCDGPADCDDDNCFADPACQMIESEEVVLAYHNDYPGGGSFQDKNIEDDKWYGTHFKPQLPANALSWKITRVKLMLEQRDDPDTFIDVQIRNVDAAGTPGSVIESVRRDEALLPIDFAWVEFAFSSVAGLDPAARYCVMGAQDPVNKAAKIMLEDTGSDPPLETYIVFTENAGAGWKVESIDKKLRFYVYGTYTTMGPPEW
jgi:hypothetical protein